MTGEKNQANIREIGLIDLITEILLHWRGIIVLMLIGGILFAGYSYKQSYDVAEAQKAKLEQMEAELAENESVEEADKQWLEEQLSDTQINNVKTAIDYEKLYEDKMNYQAYTLSVNIDPFNVPKGDVTFLIESDDMQNTYNIQKVYEDMVTSAAFAEYIDKECELTFSASSTVGLERSSYDLTEGCNIVRVVVYNDEEKTCQQIVDTIVSYVMTQKELLSETLGEHEVSVLEQSVGTIAMPDYVNVQKNFTAEVMSLRSSIIMAKEAFSDEEWRYYNYLTTGKATENPDVDKEEEVKTAISMETIQEPGVSVKYVILGMLLFVFGYVFVIFVKYILNNKLRPNDSLADLYDLPELGHLSVSESKKRMFACVDTTILSLRERNKRKFTEEEAINMATVAIKMAVQKTADKEVYLVGCDMKNQTADICEQITKLLAKDDIQVKVLDNVLYNAETMSCLANAHSVVLVEKAGSTLYDEIQKELELMARQDITVLGGIVVG